MKRSQAAPLRASHSASAPFSGTPTTHVLVLIPAYVASLLRYRLLCDTLRSLSACHIPDDVMLHIHVSYQARVEAAAEDGKTEDDVPPASRRALQTLAASSRPRPEPDAHLLDSTLLSEPIDPSTLHRCVMHPRIRLHLHAQPSIAVGAPDRPHAQFEHLRRLYDQVVRDDDIVLHHDDDDLTMPNRIQRITEAWAAHPHASVILHSKLRFTSSSVYTSPDTAMQIATAARNQDASADEWLSDPQLIEFWQYAVRGSVLLRLAAHLSTKDHRRAYCDLELGRLLFDAWHQQAEEAPTLPEGLVVQRKSLHRRFYDRGQYAP